MYITLYKVFLHYVISPKPGKYYRVITLVSIH